MSRQGESYQPSNGTEGMWFCGEFCDQCIHHDPTYKETKTCDILPMTMVYSPGDPEYPKEWIYGPMDKPTCTKFVNWNWGDGNDDDDYNPPPPPAPKPPANQLDLFPFTHNNDHVHELTPQKQPIETNEPSTH